MKFNIKKLNKQLALNSKLQHLKVGFRFVWKNGKLDTEVEYIKE